MDTPTEKEYTQYLTQIVTGLLASGHFTVEGEGNTPPSAYYEKRKRIDTRNVHYTLTVISEAADILDNVLEKARDLVEVDQEIEKCKAEDAVWRKTEP